MVILESFKNDFANPLIITYANVTGNVVNYIMKNDIHYLLVGIKDSSTFMRCQFLRIFNISVIWINAGYFFICVYAL